MCNDPLSILLTSNLTMSGTPAATTFFPTRKCLFVAEVMGPLIELHEQSLHPVRMIIIGEAPQLIDESR